MPTPTATPSRLVVLMFTDVAGSTDLKVRVGGEVYARLAARHDELFKAAVASVTGGEVLKDLGDGFMTRFQTASSAVQAALRLQQALRAERWEQHGGEALRVRIGLHLGEVSELGPDILGKPKVVGLAADLAARVMSLALPGQVLLTRGAFDDARQYVREHPAALTGVTRDSAGNKDMLAQRASMPPTDGSGIKDMLAQRAGMPPTGGADAPPLRWIAHGPYLFKGAEEGMDVFEVGAEGIAPLRVPPDSEKARRIVRADEEDALGWRPAAGLEIPRRAGWRLERKLGEGGFGEVWLASHARTKGRRVFKFCFDVDRLRSFKRELTLFRLLREVLGARDDIATLHEVELERPPFFLESEFTELGNLKGWAQAKGGIAAVPLATRLDLLARVADAVGAAHSVGVLHKDLKPSNVLIAEDEQGAPRPVLSDFGIGMLADATLLKGAHITAAGFTETLVTEVRSSRTGTRMYAPPESVTGEAFTVQGDVYSLGVMLYQLVVADFDRPLAPGWERDVSDELLREDIALCVDGDRARRLKSAAELSERLRRLESRRAAARQEKRRRRVLRWSVGAAVVLAIAAGVAGLGLVRERGLLREAERQRRIALAVTQFLVSDMLGAADERPNIRVADVLGHATAAVSNRFAGDPLVEASVESALGEAWLTIGHPPEAIQLIDHALSIWPSDIDPSSTVPARAAKADALMRLGRLVEAEASLQPILGMLERLQSDVSEEYANAMHVLADIRMHQARYKDAAALFDALVSARERRYGSHDRRVHLVKYDQALMRVLQAKDSHPAPNEPDPLQPAIDRMISVRDEAAQDLGLDHPVTLRASAEVGKGLRRLAERTIDEHRRAELLVRAEESLRPLSGRMRTVFTESSWRTAEVTAALGRVEADLGKKIEAEQTLRAAFSGYLTTRGADHSHTRLVAAWLAEASWANNRSTTSDAILLEAFQTLCDQKEFAAARTYGMSLKKIYKEIRAVELESKWDERLHALALPAEAGTNRETADEQHSR